MPTLLHKSLLFSLLDPNHNASKDKLDKEYDKPLNPVRQECINNGVHNNNHITIHNDMLLPLNELISKEFNSL